MPLGEGKSLEYLEGVRRGVENSNPIIGDYGVNSEGSGDMYFKGANLLNTIRSIYNDDELWWKTLKDYTETYKHKIITTEATETFFDKATNVNLKPVFDQYLRNSALPELQLKKDGKTISYRWKADVENFQMPVDIFINNKEVRLQATSEWQKLDKNASPEEIKVNELEFYISTSRGN